MKDINKTWLKEKNSDFKIEELEIINNINPFINENEIINMSDFRTEASFIEGKNKYILGVGPVNAHKKDEFITIKSLELLEKQYIDIINKNI